jgi:putative endonuclease
MKTYFVYIMTNKRNTVIYTGVTSDLPKRMFQHRERYGGTFTSKYKVNKLVYYEACESVLEAIAREKQIKAGSRARKVALIEEMNPNWDDLWDRL